MKNLIKISAIILIFVIVFYTFNDASAEKMCEQSIWNIAVGTSIVGSAVDFNYTLVDCDQVSPFYFQYDNNPLFSSPDATIHIATQSSLQNVNIAATLSGSGVTVHYRVLNGSTELYRANFMLP